MLLHNGPGWSVGIEVFLYACFPLPLPVLVLVIARLRSLRSLVIALAVVVAALLLGACFSIFGRGDLPPTDPGSAHRSLFRMPLPRLLDFTLGVLVARLYLEPRGSGGWRRIGTPLAVIGGVATFVLMAWPAHFWRHGAGTPPMRSRRRP